MHRTVLYRLLILAAALCLLPQSALAGAQQPEEVMIPRIGVHKAYQHYQQGQIVFLDARAVPDWNASEVKIPGARRVLREEEIDRFAAQVGKDQRIVTYCT